MRVPVCQTGTGEKDEVWYVKYVKRNQVIHPLCSEGSGVTGCVVPSQKARGGGFRVGGSHYLLKRRRLFVHFWSVLRLGRSYSARDSIRTSPVGASAEDYTSGFDKPMRSLTEQMIIKNPAYNYGDSLIFISAISWYYRLSALRTAGNQPETQLRVSRRIALI